ncbi:Abi-alpha family protein [Psychroserpens damuponensis]|uniref:Abi-alpha family protein n=1 Tax=Psychroserpens damuponensis TaxID=943936 RepID=UPI0006948AD2|nr:Abi-alpha family protein [Psychroserpens damuponensis]
MLEKYLGNIPIKDLYKDLFKPGMKKAGEALETVLDGANLILLPLKLINSKSKIYFEKNLEKYSDKLNKNTELTPTQVPQYVGLPIIDKLTYLDQNELAETFINLLTKASFDETLKLVHPSYISILNNLSADEAKILFHFKNSKRIPFIDFYIHRYVEKFEKPNFHDNKGTKTKEQLKQMIDYSTQNKEDVYLKAAWNLTGIENSVSLIFPENIDIYIENLEQNGLISYERETLNKYDLEVYDKLENVDYKNQKGKIEKEISDYKGDEFKLELNTRKAYIEFTTLGKGFIDACIKEIE